MCDTPAARARAVPHAQAQTGSVSFRPQRAQPPNSQGSTPPRPPPTLPPTSRPTPHTSGFFAGASNPAPPSCTRVDRRRSDGGAGGGGGTPRFPVPHASAGVPKRCCLAIARVCRRGRGPERRRRRGIARCCLHSALHRIVLHGQQRPFCLLCFEHTGLSRGLVKPVAQRPCFVTFQPFQAQVRSRGPQGRGRGRDMFR